MPGIANPKYVPLSAKLLRGLGYLTASTATGNAAAIMRTVARLEMYTELKVICERGSNDSPAAKPLNNQYVIVPIGNTRATTVMEMHRNTAGQRHLPNRID